MFSISYSLLITNCFFRVRYRFSNRHPYLFQEHIGHSAIASRKSDPKEWMPTLTLDPGSRRIASNPAISSPAPSGWSTYPRRIYCAYKKIDTDGCIPFIGCRSHICAADKRAPRQPRGCQRHRTPLSGRDREFLHMPTR